MDSRIEPVRHDVETVDGVSGDVEHDVGIRCGRISPSFSPRTDIARAWVRPAEPGRQGGPADPPVESRSPAVGQSGPKVNNQLLASGRTLRVLRASSRTLICSSNRRMAWLSPEVDTLSFFAAFVKLRLPPPSEMPTGHTARPVPWFDLARLPFRFAPLQLDDAPAVRHRYALVHRGEK
jgi:hypothetical protein